MIRHVAILVLATAAMAAADPRPAPKPTPKPTAAQLPPALPELPPKPREPRSLRDEAARVASDLVAGGQPSRDPDLLLMPWQIGRWSADGRAGKLEGGAAASTLIGEAILGLGGSPLAAIGALAAGATLDAAAADVEAASPPPNRKPKPIKHRLR